LWVTPYDVRLDPELAVMRDFVNAARDGTVAAMPQAGKLSLLRMLDGGIIWERDLRGERVANIWMAPDRVLTADVGLGRVHIFDHASGHLVRQVLFEQPAPEVGPTRVVITDSMLCGPHSSTSEGDAVRGISLETGEEKWRYALTKPIAQLFQLGPSYVGAGLLGGDLLVLDANTGELVLERHVSNGLPVVDGALVDGTLVVLSERRQGQLRVPELAAIDVATGEELWPRNDLAALQEPVGRLIVYGGAIPAILSIAETMVDGRAVTQVRNSALSLGMIDIRTGVISGETAELPPATSGTRLTRDLAIRDGMIAVGSNRSIQAFRLTAPTRKEAASTVAPAETPEAVETP
jgi:outer membrane protein assembly factor BamB